MVDTDLKTVERTRSLRSGFVLKSSAEGTVRIVVKQKQGEMEVTVEIKGKFTGTETGELKDWRTAKGTSWASSSRTILRRSRRPTRTAFYQKVAG